MLRNSTSGGELLPRGRLPQLLRHSRRVRTRLKLSFAVLAACLSLCAPGLADDSAAAIGAGGLVARRESRIVMAREVLRIRPATVVVDYDFRNESDDNVTTVVAFPVPPYTNQFPEWQGLTQQSFQSFHVWVNGKAVACKTEAKAWFKGEDVTNLLREHRIDIPTPVALQKVQFCGPAACVVCDGAHRPPAFDSLLSLERGKML
jgi:hypothetical protein